MHCQVKEVIWSVITSIKYDLIAICGEIVCTPSDDNEASSVGISSGAQPLPAAQDSHCFFIVVTFGAEYEFLVHMQSLRGRLQSNWYNSQSLLCL